MKRQKRTTWMPKETKGKIRKIKKLTKSNKITDRIIQNNKPKS